MVIDILFDWQTPNPYREYHVNLLIISDPFYYIKWRIAEFAYISSYGSSNSWGYFVY